MSQPVNPLFLIVIINFRIIFLALIAITPLKIGANLNWKEFCIEDVLRCRSPGADWCYVDINRTCIYPADEANNYISEKKVYTISERPVACEDYHQCCFWGDWSPCSSHGRRYRYGLCSCPESFSDSEYEYDGHGGCKHYEKCRYSYYVQVGRPSHNLNTFYYVLAGIACVVFFAFIIRFCRCLSNLPSADERVAAQNQQQASGRLEPSLPDDFIIIPPITLPEYDDIGSGGKPPDYDDLSPLSPPPPYP